MKYFYYSIEDEEEVDGNDSLEDVLELFYQLPDEEGSFFGLINDKELILQFAWEDEDNWNVDIPQVEKGGSYKKNANYDECVSLIKDFFNEKSINYSEGYTFNLYPG